MQYLHSLHLRVIAFRCIICCIMCIRGMTAYLLQFMRARTLGKCTTQTPPPSPQVPPRLLPPPLPSPLPPTPSASPPPLLLPRGMTAYLLQFEGKNLRQVHPDSSPSPPLPGAPGDRHPPRAALRPVPPPHLLLPHLLLTMTSPPSLLLSARPVRPLSTSEESSGAPLTTYFALSARRTST